jgi:hypothetical protein
MTSEQDVYRALLKRMTGEDVEITHSRGMWEVQDNAEGNWGMSDYINVAAIHFFEAFVASILAYVNEPDDALDANAQALKRHYQELLGEE